MRWRASPMYALESALFLKKASVFEPPLATTEFFQRSDLHHPTRNELENKIHPLKNPLNFFSPRRPGFLRVFLGVFYVFCWDFVSKSTFQRGYQQGVAHAWDNKTKMKNNCRTLCMSGQRNTTCNMDMETRHPRKQRQHI